VPQARVVVNPVNLFGSCGTAARHLTPSLVALKNMMANAIRWKGAEDACLTPIAVEDGGFGFDSV